MKLNKIIIKKSKKGVSIMIGYVLLISAAIVMGAVVYQWMKSYVPKEALECPEGVSVFISDVRCEDIGGNLVFNIDLKNNGRFNIGGYFIRGETNINIATDLSGYSKEGEGRGGSVLFMTEMKPSESSTYLFNFSGSNITQVYSIEITPLRFQIENNRKRLVSCSNAKIKEIVAGCSVI